MSTLKTFLFLDLQSQGFFFLLPSSHMVHTQKIFRFPQTEENSSKRKPTVCLQDFLPSKALGWLKSRTFIPGSKASRPPGVPGIFTWYSRDKVKHSSGILPMPWQTSPWCCQWPGVKQGKNSKQNSLNKTCFTTSWFWMLSSKSAYFSGYLWHLGGDCKGAEGTIEEEGGLGVWGGALKEHGEWPGDGAQ